MINPHWLRSFCSLVEIAHFTRTAEQLNMTQSGVSQHIRKLEEQLGKPLLIRHGKQFTLTDAGECLYQEGRHVLNSLEQLEKQVGEDSAFEGVVRVVSPGSVGLKLYRQLLLLQKKHPKLIIDYRFAPNREVERFILEHKADIGFMTSSSVMNDVHMQAIAEEELLLVTPNTLQSPSWRELQALGFIDHPDGAYHAGLLLGANYPEFEAGQTFKKSGFSNQISLILDPVAMGLGFTVLPRHAISAFNNPDRIFVNSLANSVSETLYLGVHRHKRLSNRMYTVIEEAKRCLQ